jgi:hypothetical protein
MTSPSPGVEQREVCDRVLDQYVPAWCASPSRPARLDPLAFDHPDWSFLTPGLAHWFLIAVDQGVVEVTSNGDFIRGSSFSEGLFEHGPKARSPRPMKLRRESFFEIAAVGMLAARYGWPAELLRFQSPKWAFDLLAYLDDAHRQVAIAGEAKRLQREAVALSASLKVCGGRGDHLEDDCTERSNHHKKYAELRELRPRLVWIVGPDAFAPEPDLVFRVEGGSGGIVRLRHADPSELTFTRN